MDEWINEVTKKGTGQLKSDKEEQSKYTESKIPYGFLDGRVNNDRQIDK
jgi:hypothetical protein